MVLREPTIYLSSPTIYLSSFVENFLDKYPGKCEDFFERVFTDLFGLGGVGVLESCYRIKGKKKEEKVVSVFRFIKDRFGCDLPVMVDSGAYSLYQEYVVKKKRIAGVEDNFLVDYSWASNPEVLEFFDYYIKWLKEKEKEGILDEYVNLDIIGNPELSFENWKKMKEEGLEPIPVVHSGAGIEWVEKYLNIIRGKGICRFGIGGVRFGILSSNYWCASVFDWINRNFGSNVKTHFFAVSRPDFALQFGAWTVDTATWAFETRYAEFDWFSVRKNRSYYLSFNQRVRSNKNVSDEVLNFYKVLEEDREVREEFFYEIEVIAELLGKRDEVVDYLKSGDIKGVLKSVFHSNGFQKTLNAVSYVKKWRSKMGIKDKIRC